MADDNSKTDKANPTGDQATLEIDSSGFDKSALRYEDGKCFYKDPASGVNYEWKESTREWVTVAAKPEDYTFDGETYHYNDKITNINYKWNEKENKWVQHEGIALTKEKIKTCENDEEVDTDDEDKEQKEIIRQDMSKGTYGTDGSTLTYTDPNDGTVYLWDKEKNAWFPKVDEDFLARYQLSYGFTNPEDQKIEKDDSKVSNDVKIDEQESLKRKAPQEPAWFDVSDETNNKVYVNNLPLDITETEFVDLMQKCGLVMKDVDTGKLKVKLYTEKGTDILKGDALCTYIKVESVELALNLLDGYKLRDNTIHVERAKFTMKGAAYDPSLKPKKKKKKVIEKIKKMQEKLFDWRPEKMVGERAKHERIVIIKNLFDPKIFDNDVALILEYQEDLREECRKCGDVRKVVLFDRHPEGVAQVIFKEAEAADACVQLLNLRWFGKRQITAETWDGKTKYKIAETEAEIAERLRKWDQYLKDEEKAKTANKKIKAANKKIKAANKKTEVDNEETEIEKKDTKTLQISNDSDGTRSSAGSGDDTDDEH